MQNFNLSNVSISTKPVSSEEIKNLSAKALIEQYLISKQVLKLQEKDAKSPRMIQKWQKTVNSLKAAIFAKYETVEAALAGISFSETQKNENEKFQEFVEMFKKSKKTVKA